MKPPVAPKRPHVQSAHGIDLTDDYFWLRERENQDVLDYLEAENAYTEAVMEPTLPLQERLYSELLSRIQETDLSVPVRVDDWFYYSRTEEGKQYGIHCRKPGSTEADEEILLDENVEAEGHDYFSLGSFEPSPDHKLLAFSTDTEGDERYVLRVKDLATGKLLTEEIPGLSTSVAWANDSRTLFYTVLDEAHRPWRVFRHVLGADPANDVLVFEETNPGFYVGVGRTRSRKYIMVSSGSSTSTEERFLPADEPEAEFRMIAPRAKDVEYDANHHGDHFYIVTNRDAVNFKVVRAGVDSPETWEDFVPHRTEIKIDGIDVFRDHLVIHKRQAGLTAMEVLRFDTGDHHEVEFPEPVYTVGPGPNPEFATRSLRFHYTSPITPGSVFDYDLDTRERVLRKETPVPGDYDRTRYTTERIHAVAEDGTRIPMSVLRPKDFVQDGSAPCLLYGYGSYGITIDPTFNPNRFSLVDRGFVVVTAHIRGGGAMGRPWYDAGKLKHKRNTFTDFVACAEFLLAGNYTSTARLGIMGGSAGGLLMGAVLNMRPDLFGAAVSQVPFVDVINTMLDADLPLTVIEYDEWGNPNEFSAFETMMSYSPYDNVGELSYPPMLVTAGLNDPRVQYWEPAKWVARLRERKTSDAPLLLKTEMGSGHAGASGRYDRLKEVAFDYAFLIHTLEAPEEPA